MENVREGRIAVFTKKYLTKLLLAAVILTAGFSLRFVALAKYTSYLYDFTGAVASDFCFTSNYLSEGEPKKYSIGKWDGKEYSLDLELRNYENALRYNKANVDTCYYLDIKVDYKSGNEWVTDETAMGHLSVSGGSTAVSYTQGEYGTDKKPCFLLKGIDDSSSEFKFNRKNGTHNIKIVIDQFGHQDDSHRISVTAQTIPASLKKYLADDSPEALKEYTGCGVYDVTLRGEFTLSKEEVDNQSVKESCSRRELNNLEMVYTLTCTSLSSGTTKVRIYYNPKVITPDPAMVQRSQDGIKDGEGKYAGRKYVTISVQSNCIVSYSLFSAELEEKYHAEDAIKEKADGLADVFCVLESQADGPGGQPETPLPDEGT